MNIRRTLLAAILTVGIATATTGCSSFHTKTLATGAAGGAAAGAGTGAIIGALIANGDVAASALLGGAVGIPAGLAIAAVYDYHSEPSVQERNAALIENNQQELYARQKELERMRQQITEESMASDEWYYNSDYHYNGHTLGNHFR